MSLIPVYIEFVKNMNPQMPKYQEIILTRLLSGEILIPSVIIPKQNNLGKKSTVVFIDESIGKES